MILVHCCCRTASSKATNHATLLTQKKISKDTSIHIEERGYQGVENTGIEGLNIIRQTEVSLCAV